MNNKIVPMILIFIITTIFVSLQQIHFQTIFQSNLQVAHLFQKLDSPPIDYYLNTIQHLGNGGPITILLIIVYELSSNKNQTFILLLLSCLGGFFNFLLKMLHTNPRPYMLYFNNQQNIESKECSKEYGNPSGHSFIVVFVLGSIMSIITRYFRNKAQSNTFMFLEHDQQLVQSLSFHYKQSIFQRRNRKINIQIIMIRMLITLVMISILFNRIFNFTHSYGQVIYGSLVGLLFIFWFELIKDFPLNSLIMRQSYKDHQQQSKTQNYLKMFITFCVVTIGSVYIGFLATKPDQYQPLWIENMLKCMGNDNNIKKGYVLHGYCLVKMSILYLFIGMMAGILGQKPVYNTQQIQINSKYRYYQIVQIRLGLQVMICGVLYCGIVLAREYDYLVQHVVSSVVFWIIGFSYTFMLPQLYLKLGVVQKDDFYILEPSVQSQLVQYQQVQLSHIQ